MSKKSTPVLQHTASNPALYISHDTAATSQYDLGGGCYER